MTNIPIQPLTKKLLCVILGISKNTLTRHLKRHKETLKSMFPSYIETNSRINTDTFVFICSQFGVSKLQIAVRMKNHFPNCESIDVQIIIDFYGLY
jgi:hypothetical protein